MSSQNSNFQTQHRKLIIAGTLCVVKVIIIWKDNAAQHSFLSAFMFVGSHLVDWVVNVSIVSAILYYMEISTYAGNSRGSMRSRSLASGSTSLSSIDRRVQRSLPLQLFIQWDEDRQKEVDRGMREGTEFINHCTGYFLKRGYAARMGSVYGTLADADGVENN